MNEQRDVGGPAFPDPWNAHPDASVNTPKGMSMRDYLAAHAPAVPEWFSRLRLYGADPNTTGSVSKDAPPATLAQQQDAFIAWRWYYADAMLKARTT